MGRIIEQTLSSTTWDNGNGTYTYQDGRTGAEATGHSPETAEYNATRGYGAPAPTSGHGHVGNPFDGPAFAMFGAVLFAAIAAFFKALVKPVPATATVAAAALLLLALSLIPDDDYRNMLSIGVGIGALFAFGPITNLLEVHEGRLVDRLNRRTRLGALCLYHSLFLYTAGASWWLAKEGVQLTLGGPRETRTFVEWALIPAVVAALVCWRRYKIHPTLKYPVRH